MKGRGARERHTREERRGEQKREREQTQTTAEREKERERETTDEDRRTLRRRCRMLEDPMDLKHNSERTPLIVVWMVVLTTVALSGGNAFGQVRSKKPDRSTYQSPRLEPVDVEPLSPTVKRLESAMPAPAIV